MAGGPAERYGLKEGDIIIGVEKKRFALDLSFTMRCGKSVQESESRLEY